MHDARPFWLINLFQTLVIAAIAYVVSIFLELVLLRIAQVPHGALWVPEFQTPFLFIITGIVVGLLAIPYFMKEWDPSLRTFSMFSATFLMAMAVFTQTGAFDPELPLRYLTTHVFLPLRHKLGF